MNVFEKCNHNVHKLRQEFVQLIIDSENKSKHKGLFKNVVDFIEEVKKNKTLWKRLEEILRKAKRKMKGKNLTMVTIENELASTLADLREINGFVLDYMEEKKIENRKTILTNLENKKEKDNEVKIKNYDDAMNKVLF
ncbi:MAG: hypothetical protein LBL77_00955, partial [Endomicrobium sp.]|nr:hypothetical protein [Endomicrobium sp.]